MFSQTRYILFFPLCCSPETHFKLVVIIYSNKVEGPHNWLALMLK